MKNHITISITLIILACLSTMLMVHSQHKSKNHHASQLDKKPNAYMSNVNYREYDLQGHLKDHVIAKLVQHYPFQNSTSFVDPIIHTKTQAGVPWKITADFGRSKHGNQWINLWGNVQLHQPTRPGNPETTILTSSLIYYPQRSFAESKHTVTIIQPGSHMSGKGVKAYLKTGIIQSLSHSKDVYSPSHVIPVRAPASNRDPEAIK